METWSGLTSGWTQTGGLASSPGPSSVGLPGALRLPTACGSQTTHSPMARYDYLSGFEPTPTPTLVTTTLSGTPGGLQDEPQCSLRVGWRGETHLDALLVIRTSIIVQGEDSAMDMVLSITIFLGW